MMMMMMKNLNILTVRLKNTARMQRTLLLSALPSLHTLLILEPEENVKISSFLK